MAGESKPRAKRAKTDPTATEPKAAKGARAAKPASAKAAASSAKAAASSAKAAASSAKTPASASRRKSAGADVSGGPEAAADDHLASILARKEREVARRKRHPIRAREDDGADRRSRAIAALRRWPGSPPRVIAEIKRRSPSAGELRPRATGDVAELARAYERAGAAAISVLADGPAFAGSVLDVRRAARAMSRPVLFKEFVIDTVQIDAARAAGASLVLLLVAALPELRLDAMIDAVRARGMEPIVEAHDGAEIQRALATNAVIVGVNARDLRSLEVDADAALAILDELPDDRVAVYMSGVSDRAQLARVAAGRADAVLIGSELMRAPDPGARLAELLATRSS